MGELVSLEEYRKSNSLEEEYLKFLSHVNKFNKVPTDIPELMKCFYFTLRYLEGTVNCFEILSVIKGLRDEQIQDIKVNVGNYLESILHDLRKY